MTIRQSSYNEWLSKYFKAPPWYRSSLLERVTAPAMPVTVQRSDIAVRKFAVFSSLANRSWSGPRVSGSIVTNRHASDLCRKPSPWKRRRFEIAYASTQTLLREQQSPPGDSQRNRVRGNSAETSQANRHNPARPRVGANPG